jgi:hypothetical protein
MLKGLLIGINYYDSPYQLHGCINDIMNMKEMLITHFNFKEESLIMLSDDENTFDLPTRDTILFNMKSLITNAQPGDTIVFHYSGHGVQVRDYNGDEPTGYDEAIVPMDYLTNGVISDDIIFLDFISLVPEDVKLVNFFDCCHSGTICDLQYNVKYTSPYKATTDISQWDNNFTFWDENDKHVKGIVNMYSGCYDDQTSADANINMMKQGAFTFVLLDILKKFNYDISHKELLKQINANLSLDAYPQRSQFSCSKPIIFEDKFCFEI